MNFPRLYAIVDAETLAARSINLSALASGLFSAGVQLIQYRSKIGEVRSIVEDAERLKKLRSKNSAKLIMNDRADLTLLCGFDGVHLGQEDLQAEDAREIVGPSVWVGVSTHSIEQVIEADKTSCNTIAFGPVFPTTTKNNPDPTVGLSGLQAARVATHKPLVAIGGITRENCRSVLDAGADSVAVISGLLPPAGTSDPCAAARKIAEEFLEALGP
jgi:thiamine-phosphate pyrophosphorylase